MFDLLSKQEFILNLTCKSFFLIQLFFCLFVFGLNRPIYCFVSVVTYNTETCKRNRNEESDHQKFIYNTHFLCSTYL